MLFYEENEISEHLKCPYCKNKYKDPRIVECSTSFCMLCIEILTKECENGFKCPVCEDFHEIPPKGYLKNFNLDQISDKKANEVTRGSLADTLKAQLGELKQNTDELANWIESSANKINKHCNDLRSEVSLSSDKLIQSIYNLKSDLICQIDDYEIDLNANCDISAEYKTRLAEILNETNGIHAKWADYLKLFELNDQDLELASSQVSAWLENVKNELNELIDKVFGGRLLRFFENNQNNTSSIIGTLGHDASHLINQKQLNELKIYRFGDKLNNSRDHRYAIRNSLRVQFLDNENICMAYQYIVIGSPYSTLETDIYLSMFDSSLNRLRTKCFDDYIVGEFNLAKLDGSILLCLIQPKEKEAENDESDLNLDDGSIIMKFDQDLNLLKEISIDYKIKAVDGFGSHLYCLSSIHNVNRKVCVYDANLKQIMSIGQHEDWEKPFYISNTFEKMRVCELYIAFLDRKQVVFINKENGWDDKKFNSHSFDFELYGDELHAFKYDNIKFNLVKYDSNGFSQNFSIGNSNLSEKMKENMELVDFFNGRFIFINKNNLCLIF